MCFGKLDGLAAISGEGSLPLKSPRASLAAFLYDGRLDADRIMLFKIIAFIAAAIPLILFVRSIFFRRPTRFSEGLKEFRKQIDVAVWIFLGLVGCVVVFAVGKLVWTWWTSL